MADNVSLDVATNDMCIATPDLGKNLHWNNSSNVLCKYMKEPRYLYDILKESAIIPRYVIEPLDYLNLGNIRSICFPMICFCDIPFSKVSTHMSRYGEYGIGLDKDAVLEKYRIQPIHYINDKSPLAHDFREAFQAACREITTGTAKILTDYILSTLMYMKPICGQFTRTNVNGDIFLPIIFQKN